LCDAAQMAIFDDFLRPVFAASPVQHVSDLHLKFALRPHHVCKYASMVDIQSVTAEIRRGKKRGQKDRKKKKKKKKPQGKTIMSASAT